LWIEVLTITIVVIGCWTSCLWLLWIANEGGIIVKDQVSVPISIEKYKEEVIYGVVPIETGHILLGQPWQVDNKLYMMASLIRLVSCTRVKRSFFILSHLNKWERMK